MLSSWQVKLRKFSEFEESYWLWDPDNGWVCEMPNQGKADFVAHAVNYQITKINENLSEEFKT